MNTENVKVGNNDYSNKLRENNQEIQQKQRRVEDNNVELKTRQNALRLQDNKDIEAENIRVGEDINQRAQTQISSGYLDVKI